MRLLGVAIPRPRCPILTAAALTGFCLFPARPAPVSYCRPSCTITDFVLPYPDIIVIIRRYYDQLEEEREYRHEFRLNPTTSGTYEAKEGLLTQGHYPYTDNHNAFGVHNHA